MLALWHDKSRASADVKAFAMRHVRDLETKIAELQAMSRTLRHLARTCHGDQRPDCPILADLAESGANQAPSGKRLGKAKPPGNDLCEEAAGTPNDRH